MRKKILESSNYFTENFNANIYCDIALENYFLTKDVYKKILDASDPCDEYLTNYDYYHSKQIICTVFSQMCIESLLNDFIVEFLTKNEIDSFYDKLSIQDKIKFIAKFILNKKVKTDGILFNCLSLTTKNRNANIHNKSILISYKEFHAKEKEFKNIKLNKNDFQELFVLAKQSIIAIIETANFLSIPKPGYCTLLDMLFIGEYGKDTDLRNMAVKEFKIAVNTSI